MGKRSDRRMRMMAWSEVAHSFANSMLTELLLEKLHLLLEAGNLHDQIFDDLTLDTILDAVSLFEFVLLQLQILLDQLLLHSKIGLLQLVYLRLLILDRLKERQLFLPRKLGPAQDLPEDEVVEHAPAESLLEPQTSLVAPIQIPHECPKGELATVGSLKTHCGICALPNVDHKTFARPLRSEPLLDADDNGRVQLRVLHQVFSPPLHQYVLQETFLDDASCIASFLREFLRHSAAYRTLDVDHFLLAN